MGISDDSSYFNPLQSPFATAQYRPTPSGTFPNAPVPGPLSIPPAQPPIFLSPPDPADAPEQPAGPWGSLVNGINNHALTLMALGAGIAQGGVGRGLADAATAAATERNRQAQQLNFLQTYKALTDGGVPPQEAQAAIGNPSLMRALAAKYLGPRASGVAPGGPAVPVGVTNSNPGSRAAPTGNYPAPTLQGDGSNGLETLNYDPAMRASVLAPPAGLPNGAAYSPSRGQWRDPDGNIFDQQGRRVR